MARLGISERRQIKIMKLQGWSYRKIANHFKCNLKTVQRWSSREFDNMNDKARRCRSKFTKKIKRAVFNDIKRYNSLRKTANQHGISHSSVYKMVRRNSKNKTGLFPYKQTKNLTPKPDTSKTEIKVV